KFRQPWPQRSVFSQDGLRYAQFGHRNFAVVDIDAREAVAFVSEDLVADGPGFTSPFIDTLFYMSSGRLGLAPLACACVGLQNRGLLILGRPNQGKTTAAYLASRNGLTFHADQSVFLDFTDSGLRAWADFVPLAFRPDSLQFLPELETLTRPFSYCDFRFYYMSKDSLGSEQSGFVTPVCCVLLERECSFTPRLIRLEQSEFAISLPEHLAFEDADRFDGQRRAVLEAVGKLPAYRLSYGSDPALAAPFFRQLLTADNE